MNMKHIHWVVSACTAVALSASSIVAFAKGNTENLAGQKTTAKHIINKMKGLGLGAMTSSSAAAGNTLAKHDGSADPKLSFDQINFDLDSDRLTRSARQVLDQIAQALAQPDFAQLRVVIEGHTDSTGPLPHNMELSQRRADSVKRYLVEHSGVDAKRLQTIGKGPTDLLDTKRPESGVNRRVVLAFPSAVETGPATGSAVGEKRSAR